MAAGLRSMLGIWIGGLSAGSGTPPVPCPCPDYGHDATLSMLSKNIETLANNAKIDTNPISGAWLRKGCE
jgi:hypothetical protein